MLVVGSVSSVVSGGVKAGASGIGAASGLTQAGWAAAKGADSGDFGYYVDSLFRDDRPAAVSDDAAHAVVGRILTRTLSNDGQLAAEDRAYLAQLISQRTNLSQADAEARIDKVYGDARKAVEDAKLKAKQAAETAAKVAAYTSLWTSWPCSSVRSSPASPLPWRSPPGCRGVRRNRKLRSLIQGEHDALITAVVPRRADSGDHSDRDFSCTNCRASLLAKAGRRVHSKWPRRSCVLREQARSYRGRGRAGPSVVEPNLLMNLIHLQFQPIRHRNEQRSGTAWRSASGKQTRSLH